MARKVIGIGETILDVLFKGNQPTAAVPGGSVFNGIISLGRMGVKRGMTGWEKPFSVLCVTMG